MPMVANAKKNYPGHIDKDSSFPPTHLCVLLKNPTNSLQWPQLSAKGARRVSGHWLASSHLVDFFPDRKKCQSKGCVERFSGLARAPLLQPFSPGMEKAPTSTRSSAPTCRMRCVYRIFYLSFSTSFFPPPKSKHGLQAGTYGLQKRL